MCTEKCADSSFFHDTYAGTRILLIVPHQDDETLTGGALACRLRDAGAEVFVVYTTNGDWKYPASVRYQEAVRASGLLGVDASHIIFLGYGDAYNNEKKDHLFYHEQGANPSSSGHTKTYGANGIDEYAFRKSGEHHAYNSRNYLGDLIAVLKETAPDLIICTDLDEHPDHRMLALYIDKAIGIIRKEDPGFTPVLLKRFAYALAYTAVPDYSCVNNPQTMRPQVGVTDKYRFDLIDRSIYSWENRVRIPVPDSAAGLTDKTIAKALSAHVSQHVMTRADRIINSDEVYWERRTDSIGCLADVTASSGDPAFLNDNMLLNMTDVDARCPAFADYLWRPAADDKDRIARFTWKQPVSVEQIALYGAMDETSAVTGIRIRLSDGFEQVTGALPQTGAALVIDTGKHEDISWLEICILECYGDNYGISECEIYSRKDMPHVLHPFVKLTADDNFVYEYYIRQNTDRLKLGCYQYGDPGELNMTVVEGRAQIKDRTLYMPGRDRTIVVQVSDREGTVWDRIVIHRISAARESMLKSIQAAEQLYLRGERVRKKLSNMIFIFKKQGGGAVAERIWHKIRK